MIETDEQKLTTNSHVIRWVNEMAALCNPDRVTWCDGSEKEKNRLTDEAASTGEIELRNQETLPGCIYHRTA